jgi:hypothetical protein
MLPDVKAILLHRDRTIRKEVKIERYWYVPPRLLIDGDYYYLRTSPDGISDPLEYTEIESVYNTAHPLHPAFDATVDEINTISDPIGGSIGVHDQEE